MNARSTPAFACRTCLRLWFFEHHAAICCPPDQITAWHCDECGTIYRHEQLAQQCCAPKENEDDAPRK
jgi:RNase P subunit RPR2